MRGILIVLGLLTVSCQDGGDEVVSPAPPIETSKSLSGEWLIEEGVPVRIGINKNARFSLPASLLSPDTAMAGNEFQSQTFVDLTTNGNHGKVYFWGSAENQTITLSVGFAGQYTYTADDEADDKSIHVSINTVDALGERVHTFNEFYSDSDEDGVIEVDFDFNKMIKLKQDERLQIAVTPRHDAGEDCPDVFTITQFRYFSLTKQ